MSFINKEALLEVAKSIYRDNFLTEGDDFDMNDFEEKYVGYYLCFRDFIQEYFEESDMYKNLEAIGFNRNYIDYDAIENDWMCDFECFEYDDWVFIFRST